MRRSDVLRKRGSYIVPGPNYIWSIDEYIKLRQYGIEMYGAIDAYSRYVPWIYVEVSAATSVSIAKMCLEALEVVPIQPQYLRADRGTETSLIINAHWKLHQQSNPTIGAKQTFMYVIVELNPGGVNLLRVKYRNGGDEQVEIINCFRDANT